MIPPRTRAERLADLALIVLFAAGLAAPAAWHAVAPDPNPTIQENRKPAQLPELRPHRSSLIWFPTGFEAYYKDHFGLRNMLIRCHNFLMVRGLGTSPRRDVLIGKDGWLYFAGDKTIEEWRGIHRLQHEHLERWRLAFERRRRWLAERGIDYQVVVVPNKQTIHPEHLPDGLGKLAETTMLDQLLEHLDKYSDFQVLDLRGPMLRAKQEGMAYQRCDSHWDDWGAYVAYREMMTALSLGPWPREAFRAETRKFRDRDLARMLGQPRKLANEAITFVPLRPRLARPVDASAFARDPKVCPPHRQPYVTEHPDQSLPRLVMLRDSFTSHLAPFVSEHFRRAVYLWQRTFDYDVIERERPDVVIEEFGERMLGLLPPVDPAEELYDRESKLDVVK